MASERSRQEMPDLLVDGDACSGFADVNVAILAVHDAELLQPRKSCEGSHVTA